VKETHFCLALIDATLAEISSVELAEIAVDESVPTLLISGHPQVNDKLGRFGSPFPEKPFSLTRLLVESKQIVANASQNSFAARTLSPACRSYSRRQHNPGNCWRPLNAAN
jgi:hypothetical protein